jgi:excisionase family DNA binding protein
MSTDLIPAAPELAVDVGGEPEVGDPPGRKPRSDPEPGSDESPKRKERLARKAYSVDETAEITNLSPATIWRLISAKKLATVKVGGRRLVPHPAIDALLAAD